MVEPIAPAIENRSELQDKLSSNSVANNAICAPVSTTQRRIFKIIVVGDSGVGKTCLTFRFCGGKFPAKSEATIGVDFREKTVEVDGELIKLQIWDTAGQERFRRSMVPHYYRNVHAVLFVYDVTNEASFKSLEHWIFECQKHNLRSNIPRILVGNKSDSKSEHTVSTQAAQRFADFHHMPLFETSAKEDSLSNHVESIFLTLAHKLKAAKPMLLPNPASSELCSPDVITVHKGFCQAKPPSDNFCYC